jgi:hypothetical protein
MSLINRLLQRISGQSRHYRARRREWFSPFGIQAAQVEVLENRRLLSALTVTTAADSGAGSLRAEIAAAKSGQTINFASSLKGQTITLTSGELLINKGLTIQGPGAAQLTISGGNASRVFDVASSRPVVLTGLTISNGSIINVVGGAGGGIYEASGSNLTVSACTISNCRASSGGGIYNAGTLTVNGSSLTGDRAGGGGGISNGGTLTINGSTLSGDVAGFRGGGIFNSGTLTATNCTLSGDVAYGLGSDGGGGGIYNSTGPLTASGCTLSGNSVIVGSGGGIYQRWGPGRLTNCTIAGNSANGPAGMGGGLYLAGAFISLTNCTVSLNRAAMSGGGIADVLDVPEVLLQNSIVAGNFAFGRTFTEDIYEPYGSVAANYSLIGDGGLYYFGVGNIIGGGNGNPVINAMLGPLQNNGGPTMTMALLAGSPAIGHADNALAPSTDQRGVTRRDLAGELTDMGAYEL